jgi:hypothetical protein
LGPAVRTGGARRPPGGDAAIEPLSAEQIGGSEGEAEGDWACAQGEIKRQYLPLEAPMTRRQEIEAGIVIGWLLLREAAGCWRWIWKGLAMMGEDGLSGDG